MDTVPLSEVMALRRVLAEAQTRATIAEAHAANAKASVSDLAARNALLELQIEKLKRERFGPRSERSQRLIEQMELMFEELEATATEDALLAEKAAAKTTDVKPFTRSKPTRRPFPEHLPVERVVVAARTICDCCGSDRLSKLGETVTRTMESVPRQFKIIETVREKFTCRSCEKISQPPAPFHVTPRGLFGPSFLAMLVFEKFGQHQPLNRQRDRYALEGVDLSLSTLADQIGACAIALKPLHLLIEAHALSAERLHGDDTSVPVLAPGKTDIARFWTYVRDDRPFGGPAPPVVVFYYSRNRKG
jgi:transposase